jgi:hypothetical protein
MSRSSRVYLDDILQAIRDIREFTSEMTREQFMSDRKTQHACIRVSQSGRLPHYPFRGLLSVHSRYGLHAR